MGGPWGLEGHRRPNPPRSLSRCPPCPAMPVKRQQRAAAPTSAEDGLLLLQGQALAEEEAAKRKREMLSRFLKVH